MAACEHVKVLTPPKGLKGRPNLRSGLQLNFKKVAHTQPYAEPAILEPPNCEPHDRVSMPVMAAPGCLTQANTDS